MVKEEKGRRWGKNGGRGARENEEKGRRRGGERSEENAVGCILFV